MGRSKKWHGLISRNNNTSRANVVPTLFADTHRIPALSHQIARLNCDGHHCGIAWGHARGAGLNSSTVFAKLEKELVRRIVDRPRFEAFKKRLAKQQARVRRRDACFHVFNNQLTNPQRSDLEDG
jgi:hypothetical protein